MLFDRDCKIGNQPLLVTFAQMGRAERFDLPGAIANGLHGERRYK